MGEAPGGHATDDDRSRAAQRVFSVRCLCFLGGQRTLRVGLPCLLLGTHTVVVHVRLDAVERRAERPVAVQQVRIRVRVVTQRDHQALSFPSGGSRSSDTVAVARLQAQVGRSRGRG